MLLGIRGFCGSRCKKGRIYMVINKIYMCVYIYIYCWALGGFVAVGARKGVYIWS